MSLKIPLPALNKINPPVNPPSIFPNAVPSKSPENIVLIPSSKAVTLKLNAFFNPL